ncbi:MAG: hypothetical protein J2P18_15135 [Nocardia sp.]|nr:hypothetical protein [Nocardia sp.]
MSESSLYLVFSNPLDGRDAEFEEWYEKVHVPQVVATPGMVSAQRYIVADTEMSRMAGPPAHRYLVVYEMNEDPDTVMGRVREQVAAGTMTLHEALDIENIAMSFWNPRGPQVLH